MVLGLQVVCGIIVNLFGSSEIKYVGVPVGLETILVKDFFSSSRQWKLSR